MFVLNIGLFQVRVVGTDCVAGHLPECGEQEQVTALHKLTGHHKELYSATASH